MHLFTDGAGLQQAQNTYGKAVTFEDDNGHIRADSITTIKATKSMRVTVSAT
jgi:hypothetical protein